MDRAQDSAKPAIDRIRDVFSNPLAEAERRVIKANAVIYDPNTPVREVYLIHRGQVRLYQTRSIEATRLLEIFGPGDCFGVEAFGGGPIYGTQAVAVEESIVSVASASRLLLAASQQPQAALELIADLAKRLHAAREEAATFVFDDCNRRLLDALLRFSKSAAATTVGDEIVLRLTHQQLAQAIGVARETVSVALTQLRERSVLRTGRNQLFFKTDAIQKLIHGLNGPARGDGSDLPHDSDTDRPTLQMVS